MAETAAAVAAAVSQFMNIPPWNFQAYSLFIRIIVRPTNTVYLKTNEQFLLVVMA